MLQAYLQHSGMHWLSDPNHPHIQAGRRAVRQTFGVDPDMTRDGCSIPITLIMQVCKYILRPGIGVTQSSLMWMRSLCA